MKVLKIFLGTVAVLLLLAVLAVAGGFYALRAHYGPELPDVSSISNIPLQVPMRVYTRDGKLIGEFGAERRAPMRYADIPDTVVQSFLAAEDDRFFEHPGVDWQGLLRAGFELVRTGHRSQGGSTITMQLARNLFLTPERSYERKIKEILLALEIEKRLSKEQILETYLNRIFLGQRAYGVGAAAQVYFGKDPQHLSWGEAALLAGLPKAPSRDNPIADPQRAKQRRDYVLRRLAELGRIDAAAYRTALDEPINVHPYVATLELDARYVAEMARAEMVSKYGDEAYTRGLTVVTHIDSHLQEAANAALRNALADYDERHGWRRGDLKAPSELLDSKPLDEGAISAFLASVPPAGALVPAIVLDATSAALRVRTPDGVLELPETAIAWARLKDDDRPARGDVIRLRREGEDWKLAQIPEAEGAFVSLDPRNGGILALAGGYDFRLNKFNRVTQAYRQPGSGFKPVLYASAFDFGFTPASVVLDAPIVVDGPGMEEAWRPQNYGGDLKGPMRLREALVQSRNLVSIRLLQAVGVEHARDYAAQFGLPEDRIPENLTMALGTGVFSPLEMARAYAVLANGGYLVDPWFIESVHDEAGTELYKSEPRSVCEDCEELQRQLARDDTARLAQVNGSTGETTQDANPGVAPRVADRGVVWMVDDILRDVVRRGTATRARVLARDDLAGKTGTTNDETDAWFFGFTPAIVGVAWVGFDQPKPLGRGEVGGRAALPMWVDYMKTALVDIPVEVPPLPSGLVRVRVNAQTGQVAAAGDPNSLFEVVPAERVPAAAAASPAATQSQLQDIF